ncbi:MAG: ASCH domain-containing protein [Veillonellales bacterium]
MKAITILQPWASLIACGAKKIETRSWATKYRGPIAIHAGLKVYTRAADTRTIAQALCNGGIPMARNLPVGAVIAIAELVECLEILGSHTIVGEPGEIIVPAVLKNGYFVDSKEFAFGDYTPGRYAWLLANARPIKPVPAKGKQRLWEWEER